MDKLAQDLKYAWRNLRRSPGFVATIAITFALGVGANSAIFSLVDRVFLRPPAGLPNAGELRTLLSSNLSFAGYGGEGPGIRRESFTAIRSATEGLASVAGYSYACFGCGDPLTRMHTARATSEFLPIVARRPAIGRFFTAEEDHTAASVAVISYDLWRSEFGGDSAVLGKTLQVKKDHYTVIGVAPKGFTGVVIDATDAWFPLGDDATMVLIARLKPGVDDRKLAAAATVAFRRAGETAAEPDTSRVIRVASIIPSRRPGKLTSEGEIIVRLAGIAAIILIITVANTATLLLVHATRRRQEIAIRLALGVSRSRLCLQLLIEGALLASLGAVAATAIGVWGGNVLRLMVMPYVRWRDSVLDGRVFAFTLTVALAGGMLASLVPAFRSTRPNLLQSLAGGARSGGFRRSRVWAVLIEAQAAMSIVLVIGAGLFVRSLNNVHAIPLGYDVDRLVTATVRFDDGEDVPADFRATMTDEAGRLLAVPGVEGAGVSAMRPMSGMFGGLIIRSSGDTVPGGLNRAGGNAVGPGFFAATGMSLRAGRDFAASDVNGSPRVMIVNEAMARAVWPGRLATGECLFLSLKRVDCVTVVGVVSDAHLTELMERDSAHYYVPLAQFNWTGRPAWSASIAVRTGAKNRAPVAQALQRDLRARLPAVATIDVGYMENQIAPIYRQWQRGALFFSVLGIVALVLTAVGVFSVIAYMVSQRTHEMGVRMALGARAGDILGLVVKEGVRVVAAGVLMGIALALILGKFVASLLYNVAPSDPSVIIGATFSLALAAIAACIVPARRALRVDPMEALRAE